MGVKVEKHGNSGSWPGTGSGRHGEPPHDHDSWLSKVRPVCHEHACKRASAPAPRKRPCLELSRRDDGGRPLLYLEFSTIKYSLLAAERGSWEKPDWGPVSSFLKLVIGTDIRFSVCKRMTFKRQTTTGHTPYSSACRTGHASLYGAAPPFFGLRPKKGVACVPR